MRRMSPLTFGLAFAVLGVAYHSIKVVRVELGLAQPQSIGSLSFPMTAVIVIGATAISRFLVGLGLRGRLEWVGGGDQADAAIWF